jgi:hypothetical protein
MLIVIVLAVIFTVFMYGLTVLRVNAACDY